MQYLDLETYNSISLTAHGTHKYAKSCELLVYVGAKDDGTVEVRDLTKNNTVPEPVNKKDHICAHHSSFDRNCLLGNGYTWANEYNWLDTSMIAAIHSLPIGLDNLCQYYELSAEYAKKAKRGKELIKMFTMPQKKGKIRRLTSQTHPAEWVEFLEYAEYDVISMRKVYKTLPKWNLTQRIYNEWVLDQRINDRGYCIDIELCEQAIQLQEEYEKEGARELQKLTTVQTDKGMETLVHTCHQGAKIIEFLALYCGVTLPDLKAETVADALISPYTSKYAKKILLLRQQHAINSASKYETMLNYVMEDGRVRGTLLFAGAQRTMRWGGRGIQPHNFPAAKLTELQIDHAIKLLKIKQTKLLFSSDDVLKSLLRSAIVAEKDTKIVNCDYKSIEGRVLPWLALDHAKVQAYDDFDRGLNGGHDMYKRTYSECFNTEIEDVSKEQRKIGKVLELSMGFAGGVSAIVRGAKKARLDLDEVAAQILPGMDNNLKLEAKNWFDICVQKGDTCGLKQDTFIACDCLKRLWRTRNLITVSFWKRLNIAFENAILLQRRTNLGKIVIDSKDGFVRIRLPSGRYMCYPDVAVINGKCSYTGYVDHKWTRIFTYGGKIAENVTQAVARDILAHSLPLLEAMGYEIMFHVHDEVNAQTPNRKEYNVKEMSTLMGKPIRWAPRLPLSFEGYEGQRFKKD